MCIIHLLYILRYYTFIIHVLHIDIFIHVQHVTKPLKHVCNFFEQLTNYLKQNRFKYVHRLPKL